MLFSTQKDKAFYINEKIFLDNKPYFATSTISSVIANSEISPYGCTGIDTNKLTAIRKGFSESLDRRSNLIFKALPNQNIMTVSLLDYSLSTLTSDKAYYQSGEISIDSTGTAAHIVGEKAMVNAFYELLQKNSLFLFWYGKTFGKRIRTSDKNYIYILEDTFYPILTVICIKFQKNYFSIGLGTELDLEKCITISKNENELISNLIENSYRSNSLGLMEFKGAKQRKYLRDILFSLDFLSNYEDTYREWSAQILMELPKWLTDIRVYIIPQTISKMFNLLTLKVYSSQLYLSVPRKSDLDLTLDINKQLVNLTNCELDEIPEIPMI